MKASIQPPLTHMMMKEEGASPHEALVDSKEPQDLALLKFLLVLQVAGERKAEIEALLRGTAGLRLSKAAKEEEAAGGGEHRTKPLTRIWRKHLLKKRSAEEDDHSATSSSASSTNSSIKSTSSSRSPVSSPVVSLGGDGGASSPLSPPANGHLGLPLDHTPVEDAPTQNTNTSDMSMLQKLALNALNLTAPASSVLLNNRRNSWVQLAGHPGSLAPAGPGTIWKKRGAEPMETEAYHSISKDPARDIAPTFYREVVYQSEHFIEMQDLLYTFHNPSVMDIKMGTRTFLESEVSNVKARQDLYEKMCKVDPNGPTPEEHEAKAVTKLRYMDFRDKMSSSRSLGFRVEALKMAGSDAVTELQTMRSREDVLGTMAGFMKGKDSTKRQVVSRLRHLRDTFSKSPFFQSHEVIGCSILIIYDDDKAGVWMIDFAKTVPVPEGVGINHREPWVLGNHEEGFLTGVDNLIKVVQEVPVTKSRRLGLFSKS